MALAPNRFDDLRKIHLELGGPPLDTEAVARQFTYTVAACFAYGFPAWRIGANPLWGRRFNTTGTVSKDVLRFGDLAAIDIITSAGTVDWGLSWQEMGPSDEGFGVRRLPADRADLPAVVVAPPPPTPPEITPQEMNLFAHFRADLQPFFDGTVRPHAMFDELIRRVRTDAGLLIVDKDWPAYRAVAWWRYFNESHARSNPAHDTAQTFDEDGGGQWTTLEQKLKDYWKDTSGPLPPAPSFLDMQLPIGNFLQPDVQYFPPAVWVKSNEVWHRRMKWLQTHGYTIELAMLEQTHWGVREGLDPTWTKPHPDTPLVFEHDLKVYGWTEDTTELHRRIEIARREYGLEIVLALWEQERIEYDLDSALDKTPAIVAEFKDEVTAFRNSWEEDEVLSLYDQHRLDNAIGIAAGPSKPSGPHFANPGHSDTIYWQRSHTSKILWHQYDASHSLTELAADTRVAIVKNNAVRVVADEHSPAVRHHQYTHAKSRSRGNTCRAAGAFGGMNG